MSNSISVGSTPSTPAAKTTKRKIDDALHNLDEVLRSTDNVVKPPTKKARFPSSLYSTLAKYGIKASKGATVPERESNSDASNIIKRTAPHLSAILSRAAAKERKSAYLEELARSTVTNLHASSRQPGASEYRPSSIASFLSRLSTFKLSTYANKPASIDAVAASKAGWVNDGKDRLVCGICSASWVVVSRDGMTRDAAHAMLEKQRNYLVSMHKDGCPWKTQQCDPSIYCIPLKSPSALSKEIKKLALELDDENVMEDVEIRHPLSNGQIQAMMSSLASVRLSPPVMETIEDASTSNAQASLSELQTELEPSQTAAMTCLFGWTLAPQSQPASFSHPVTPSSTRANSVASIRSTPGTPRRSSWNASVSEAGSPGPSRPPVCRISSAMTYSSQRRDSQKERDSKLLHCALCQRRVGLWTFKQHVTSMEDSTISAVTDRSVSSAASRATDRRQSQMPKRQFDLLKEHRSYCPYVVRSTIVPSLSAISFVSPSNQAHRPPTSLRHHNPFSSFSFSFAPRNAPPYPLPSSPIGGPGNPSMVEGWRAVLTMVLRTGLGKRQRQRAMMHLRGMRSVSIAEGTEETMVPEGQSRDAMEVDGIQAMVQDVKIHGGKDILRYVRSLFA